MSHKIFLSYRRADTAGTVGRLRDRLAAHFGQRSIFQDTAAITPGDHFPKTLARAISSSKIVLCVIGRKWLSKARGARPRIEDANDYVRRELETAITNKISILPVLMNGASMPAETSLPPSIRSITQVQHIRIDDDTFDKDAASLIDVLISTLTEDAVASQNSVSELYRSLGFRVTRKAQIDHAPIEILAERHVPGVGLSRYAVDCLLSTKPTISLDELRGHLEKRGALPQEITSLVVVADTPFSKDCHSFIRSRPRVVLLTEEELRNSILDLNQSMLAFVAEYERTEIFQLYIDIELERVGGDSEASVAAIKASEFVAELLRGDRPGFHFILGDFGAGKTTLLRRIRYEASRDHLAGRTKVRPLYVQLRDYLDSGSYEQFLKETIKSNFLQEFPVSLLQAEIARGGFIVLLDGFDEISSRTTTKERLAILAQLYELFGTAMTSILTSRPAYFVNFTELNVFIEAFNKQQFPARSTAALYNAGPFADEEGANRLKAIRASLSDKYTGAHPLLAFEVDKFSVTRLRTLSEADIDIYLNASDEDFRTRCGLDWKQVKEFLLSVYDLKDLMKRPILLSMIRDTILHGFVNLKQHQVHLGITALYEAYTTMNFDRDAEKGRHRRLLSVSGRQLFCELIAITMQRNSSLRITRDQFEDIASLLLKDRHNIDPSIRGEATLDEVATDGRLSTFVALAGQDYEFTHKSFFEFFLARRLANDERMRMEMFSRYALTSEVLHFLGEFSALDKHLILFATNLLTFQRRLFDRNPILARNVIGLICSSRKDLTTLESVDFDISDLAVSNYRFSGWGFKDSHIETSSLTDSVFDKCKFGSLGLRESPLNRVTFTQCDGEIVVGNSAWLGIRMTDTKVTIVAQDRGIINGLECVDSDISLGGEFNIDGATIKASAIKLLPPVSEALLTNVHPGQERPVHRVRRVSFSGGRFDQCVMVGTHNGVREDVEIVNLDGCVVDGLRLISVLLDKETTQRFSRRNAQPPAGLMFSENKPKEQRGPKAAAVMSHNAESKRDFEEEAWDNIVVLSSKAIIVSSRWWLSVPRSKRQGVFRGFAIRARDQIFDGSAQAETELMSLFAEYSDVGGRPQ